MSKRIQKRDAEASKQLIIEHAKLLFSKNGFSSASMDELAQMCGLNKAMVFYYFKNKKGLYEAVMHEVLIEIHHIIETENKIHHSPVAELEGFIRTYADFAYTHPYLPSLLLKELSDSGALIPEILFSSMRKLFALFCDILKRGKDEEYFSDTQPMILYFMIIGTLNLMITTHSLRTQASMMDDIDIDTCADCEIVDIADYIVEKVFVMLNDQINRKVNYEI